MRDLEKPAWLRSLIYGMSRLLDLSGEARRQPSNLPVRGYFISVADYLAVAFREQADSVRRSRNEPGRSRDRSGERNQEYVGRRGRTSSTSGGGRFAYGFLGFALAVILAATLVVLIFATDGSWVVSVVPALGLIVFSISRFVVLLIALRGTDPAHRSEIIRALKRYDADRYVRRDDADDEGGGVATGSRMER